MKIKMEFVGMKIKMGSSGTGIKKAILWMACALFACFFIVTPAEAVELEDGEYSVSLEISGGSGKASVTSPTLMWVEDGTAMVQITWSSSNYDYMIVDGVTYYNLSEEGINSRFEIPILYWDTAMEVIADTTAMGEPIEITYSFYFSSDSIGDKGQLPQVAAIRVLCVAAAIIAGGGILNCIRKRRSEF